MNHTGVFHSQTREELWRESEYVVCKVNSGRLLFSVQKKNFNSILVYLTVFPAFSVTLRPFRNVTDPRMYSLFSVPMKQQEKCR